MFKMPEVKPTSNYLGWVRCAKCKESITTENLLYWNGSIYCHDCGQKVLKSVARDIKAAGNPEWKKFRAACQNAYHEAIEAARTIDDGGTCNMDAVFITWPRINETAFDMSIEGTGISGYKTKWMRTTGVIINPPSVGQANKRSKAAEAMQKVFKDFGYDATMFYMMD